MKNELKQKWLQALRSDKYKQGEGWLRYGDQFCCLGVLCDVAGKEWTRDPEGDSYAPKDAPQEWSLLDEAHRSEFGLTEEQMHQLTQMNDSGTMFHDIADHIEANI
jgi:hypothetical protein